MKKPRVLITGVNGLIGQVLIPHLAKTFAIRGLDIVPSQKGGSFRTADITEREEVQAVLDAFSPIDRVVHLAANPSVEADWHSALMTNIHGTWNVFFVASQFNVKRVVFASSNHATGCYEGIPPSLHRQPDPPTILVDDPIRPDSPYGISKITGEAIARYYYDLHGMEAVCVRIGSVLKDDDPTRDDRLRSTWLSHRDLRHLMDRALLADETFPGFGIYYGVSNNERRFWDISNAETELGYRPKDDASVLY
jgi:nucleoside-diphosphate-sugar epimerase